MLPIHAVAGVLTILFLVASFFFYRAIKKRDHTISILLKEKENIQFLTNSTTEKLENIQEQKEQLTIELDNKQSELINFALHIVQKNTFLDELKLMINELKSITAEPESLTKLNHISLSINQHIAQDKNRKLFQLQLEEANRDFYHRISVQYPQLTDKEKKLSAYIRLKLSSKEIASLLNIATKSVEINRYRLRKKFGLDSKTNLTDYILTI